MTYSLIELLDMGGVYHASTGKVTLSSGKHTVNTYSETSDDTWENTNCHSVGY